MADPSPSGVISALWRFSLALLVAALVLDFASSVVQMAWPWVVGVVVVVAIGYMIVRRFRGRGGEW